MRCVAAERQRVSWREQVRLVAMAVNDASFQQVDELRAGMLERGKDLALVGERDEKRLEVAARSAPGGQQGGRMLHGRSAPGDFKPLSPSHVLRTPPPRVVA